MGTCYENGERVEGQKEEGEGRENESERVDNDEVKYWDGSDREFAPMASHHGISDYYFCRSPWNFILFDTHCSWMYS